jgi:class 3 adenylate cyclase
MGTDGSVASLDDARTAADRRDWPAAIALLREIDAAEPLGPEDLDRLAKASWWTGDPNASIEAHERAYSAFVEQGDQPAAAMVALTLRREHASKLAGSVAAGWLTRAERLLADEPDSTAHGYLALAHGELAQGRGELGEALERFDRAYELASLHDDADLRAWALMRRGAALIARGHLDEGWALMEEVSAAATGGELGAYTTGAVFCNVIETCRNLADYQRAGEWSEAAKRWCERQSISGFPGICRVRRAEVLRLLGTWREAAEEAGRASVELRDFNPLFAAVAFHELGEVRLRLGDLDGAEEAFGQAHALGHDPQPGRALLLLRRGKADAAASSIRRSLEETTWDRLARARLLPAAALAARSTGDVAGARTAADELGEIAKEYPTAAIRADAEAAAGIAALLEGTPGEAVRRLRSARRLWHEADAPYEAATTGLLLAEAYLDDGDADAAALEIQTARASLERLGAEIDVAAADELTRRLATGSEEVRAQRTFLFTDIVNSTALLAAIGDDAWADLRRWHHDALRTCFERHGGEEVSEAGDGFFVAFPEPRAAVDCAIDIQRRLQEHRREHGFAPRVRIGVHAAEATQGAGDYSGRGVHEAARIGGLADGDEILASASTVADLRGLPCTEPRETSLKGLDEPVTVVSIAWREA